MKLDSVTRRISYVIFIAITLQYYQIIFDEIDN
jgi:hypothetical protein